MHKKRIIIFTFALIILFSFLLQPGFSKDAPKKAKTEATAINQEALKNLKWRNIGPANMGGRTTDIEGVPGNPSIVYVGTGTGGMWKTENGGITWKPIFDDQPVASIGDFAIQPGNPDVIYVGTGESNVRNSVSFGNGVYKSTDGGSSWRHLGLEETERISRVLINPENPDVVYVGALGHMFGPNKERGVYMTSDGGKTWKKVLYVDERHGVSDMDIDLQNPNIVYAALWHFERKPWTFTSGSEEGGVYKSVDGGQTWKKLSKGLPKLMGRIGVKVAPSNPSVVYVIAASKEGTFYRSDDRGETFHMVSNDVSIVSRDFYYTDLRVDPSDENRIYAVSSRLFLSIDGGKNFKRISPTTHVDFHALWIDPENPCRMWQGQDGGFAVSHDRGKKWEYVNNIPLGQFYQVYSDKRQPFYRVGGGLQDNGTWYGPSRNREPFGILNVDWRMISFGDGFFIVSHPDNPDLFLSESQAGNLVRTDMRTREQQTVSPQARRGDGGPASGLEYRFNWNAPIIPSPHDGKIIYFGGNVVFKSIDFGKTWEIISPDLTTNDPEKLKTPGMLVWPENTTAEYHCTIISLAESPMQPGILWAGTDDGNLQLSTDGGKTWENIVRQVKSIPAFSPVSHVEPSRTAAGMAYCSFDRHMFDDFRPYVFKTTNFGKTWTDVSGNLPEKAYVWVVREDPKNPNLIYAGTELGLYASYSGGKSWVKLHLKNLPTVAVHDILVHPEENDLIIGTHGRSIWICDDAHPLQQLTSEIMNQPAFLFDVRSALRFAMKSTRYGIGDKLYQGPNPPYGALITYYLKETPQKDVSFKIEILDEEGKAIRQIKKVPKEAGLNRVAWDLRYEAPRLRKEEREEDEFFRGPRGPQVLPGTYTVKLTMGDKVYKEPFEVRLDPTLDVSLSDLNGQLKCALEIRDMQSLVNDGLRALDDLKNQLKERKKTFTSHKKNASEELLKVMEDHVEKMNSIQNSLTRAPGRIRWSQSARLIERLGSLFGLIDGANAAPTKGMLQYLAELKEEFISGIDKVDLYLKKEVKQLNDVLNRHQVPPLLIPEPVQGKEQ